MPRVHAMVTTLGIETCVILLARTFYDNESYRIGALLFDDADPFVWLEHAFDQSQRVNDFSKWMIDKIKDLSLDFVVLASSVDVEDVFFSDSLRRDTIFTILQFFQKYCEKKEYVHTLNVLLQGEHPLNLPHFVPITEEFVLHFQDFMMSIDSVKIAPELSEFKEDGELVLRTLQLMPLVELDYLLRDSESFHHQKGFM